MALSGPSLALHQGEIEADSVYVLTDVRGSVLARASLTGAPVVEQAALYTAWGAQQEVVAGATLPVHGFAGQIVAFHPSLGSQMEANDNGFRIGSSDGADYWKKQ